MSHKPEEQSDWVRNNENEDGLISKYCTQHKIKHLQHYKSLFPLKNMK